jgi:hypothetical protein
MNSILDIEVSCFKNYDTPANPKTVNLLSWLQSDKYRNAVERIRAVEDKAERDDLKAKLPAITVSGLFSYHAKKDLIKHSEFIAIDIDYKGNEQIMNFVELKNHLCNILHVAYCGLSVSGRGYYCLIPIAYPDKHELHFKALEIAFKKFNITIDPACKDVSRLRGYSFDPDGYFNHNATLFTGIYEEPIKKFESKTKFKAVGNSNNKIGIVVKMIEQAPDGEKNNMLLKAANLMGGYIASGAVNEEDAVFAMENAIQNREINSFDAAKKTIKNGIAYGKKSPIDVSFTFKKMQSVPVLVKKISKPEPIKPFQPFAEVKNEITKFFIDESAPVTNENWKSEILELETFFISTTLPSQPVKLDVCSTITDVCLFVSSHVATVKANNGNKTFLPYLNRLQELKQILINTNFN